MTKKLFAFVLATVFTTAACSVHHASFKNDDFADKMKLSDGSLSGESLGPVSGEHGGAIWDECSEKAKDSMTRMIEAAKAKGANAIGNIKWYATNSASPGCKKSWGYVVIWPFLLTPLFMSTKVSGEAYKVGEGHGKKMGLLMIPADENGVKELVEKMIQ